MKALAATLSAMVMAGLLICIAGCRSKDEADVGSGGMTTAEIRQKGPEAARDMMKAKGMSKQGEMKHSTGR